MGAGASSPPIDSDKNRPNPKPAKPAAAPNPNTNTNPSNKPPSAGGPSTPPKPAAGKHNNDKVITDEADPDSQSTSAVLLSDFVYDDCVLDLTVLSPKMQVRNSKGAFLGALTIPLKLRFIHPPKRNLKPNLKFDFYDFSLLLTENEVNEEFIHKAHGGFKDINVSQLLQTRPLKVDKILNYELTTLIGRSSRIKCIRVSPDDKRLVACSHDDLKLIMYDLSTSREVLHYEGHEDTIMYCAFSRPEGKYLVSASRDATCIIWDVATAKVAHTLQHQAMVICCNYSPDGKYIVTGSQDKLCRIWESKTGKEITTFSEHGGLIIMCAFSPVCYNVVSCSADHSVMIWEARTGKCRHVLKGHAGIVLSCDWSNDNLRIVSNDEKTLRFWNAKTGEQLKEITVESKYPPQRKVVGGAVVMDDKSKSSDLKFVLSACAPNGYVVCSANNRMVQILDPNSGEEVLALSLRASVYTISCGSKNVVVLGDANGNIYVLKLHLDSDLQHLPSSAVTLMQQMGMRDELKEAD